MTEIWEIIHMPLAIICLSLGIFFIFSGALGMIRFPNFFTRTHASSLTDALGLPLVFLGYLFAMPLGLISIKVLILVGFAMITSATAAHALAKAAMLDKVPHGVEKEGEGN